MPSANAEPHCTPSLTGVCDDGSVRLKGEMVRAFHNNPGDGNNLFLPEYSQQKQHYFYPSSPAGSLGDSTIEALSDF